MQRSLSLNHSCAELSSYLIRRGTKIVAVNCECACPHSSPAIAPWFLNTLMYLNRASFFKSAMREAHTHSTRSISSSLNCDIRLSCSGVSTTTSWAPSAPILSYIPSANRAGSPSTWYSGCGCGSTRTCHTPSAGHVRMDRSFSILAGSSGHSSGAVPGASLCPRMTQDRKSTRLNSSHGYISYAVFCLKKKKKQKYSISFKKKKKKKNNHKK